MKTTNHPWLKINPIDPDAEYLIIGTHPPMPYCGRLDFYYGNTGEFWRILDRIYPGEKLFNQSCPASDDIKAFLKKYKINITDMVEATNGEPFSTDDQMQGIILNSLLDEQLSKSKVHTIYFSSFGGTNSALSLFKRWLKQNGHRGVRIPDPKEWRENVKGITIKLNDREYKLHILFSPSPTANRSASKVQPYKKWKDGLKPGIPNSYFDFRVHWYTTRLPKAK